MPTGESKGRGPLFLLLVIEPEGARDLPFLKRSFNRATDDGGDIR